MKNENTWCEFKSESAYDKKPLYEIEMEDGTRHLAKYNGKSMTPNNPHIQKVFITDKIKRIRVYIE